MTVLINGWSRDRLDGLVEEGPQPAKIVEVAVDLHLTDEGAEYSLPGTLALGETSPQGLVDDIAKCATLLECAPSNLFKDFVLDRQGSAHMCIITSPDV